MMLDTNFGDFIKRKSHTKGFQATWHKNVDAISFCRPSGRAI